MLKEEYGAEYVLNSTAEGFKEEFTALAKKLNATTLIECVGGSTTGELIECLPSRSKVLLYGALSEQGVCEIDPLLLIGRSYTIEGFILGEYIKQKGMMGALSLINKVKALMLNKTLLSKINKKFSFPEFAESIKEYKSNMTAGKFLLCPQELGQLTDGQAFEEFEI
jgi:NADPH:quinone reductase